MKSKLFFVAAVISVTLVWLQAPGAGVRAAETQPAETLRVTGCLLLSRLPDVFALHMDYNRIAVMGHADLANHVRHIVTLTGSFEAENGGLRFIVDDVEHVSPSCDSPA